MVDAPQIELVANATHPAVFGDKLLTYLNQLVTTFNTHMHPGQMAGPVPGDADDAGRRRCSAADPGHAVDEGETRMSAA